MVIKKPFLEKGKSEKTMSYYSRTGLKTSGNWSYEVKRPNVVNIFGGG